MLLPAFHRKALLKKGLIQDFLFASDLMLGMLEATRERKPYV
jgi:hypothetical protein